MKSVELVLTSPYSYEVALDRAIQAAQRAGVTLQVAYVIDPDAMGAMVYELGEQGWLGPGSQQRLRDSMMEGYRDMAQDVIVAIQQIGQIRGISLEAKVVEQPINAYLQSLLAQPGQTILVSGKQSLQVAVAPLLDQIEFIVESEW
jgi:hypothetical protein